MKNMQFLLDHKFAHRGFHNEIVPENSTKAFKLAIENGFGIEFDIRVTKDDTWVVFHDADLKRMSNENLKIDKLNFSELDKYLLGNSIETIPTLESTLNLINGKVPLLIEIKHIKKHNKHLKNLVKILDQYNGKFAIFSFSPVIINWFKKNRNNYIRGQISSFFNNKKIPKFIKYFYKSMFFNRFTKPDFISYDIENIPNKYIQKAKNKGLILFGYTARNIDQYNYSLNYLDNVVFELFNPL